MTNHLVYYYANETVVITHWRTNGTKTDVWNRLLLRRRKRSKPLKVVGYLYIVHILYAHHHKFISLVRSLYDWFQWRVKISICVACNFSLLIIGLIVKMKIRKKRKHFLHTSYRRTECGWSNGHKYFLHDKWENKERKNIRKM